MPDVHSNDSTEYAVALPNNVSIASRPVLDAAGDEQRLAIASKPPICPLIYLCIPSDLQVVLRGYTFPHRSSRCHGL